MIVVKEKLLLITLMAVAVGTVGCATVQPFNTTSLDSRNLGETTRVKMVNKLTNPAARNEAATLQNGQSLQTVSSQTAQSTSRAFASAPLMKLGPNDDLLGMVEQASGVVLLDFYADWCGPCRMQGGILHEMEGAASQNQASIIKVNVDENRQLASAFKVTSLPTLILIKDGKMIDRQVGVANHQEIASMLSR